MEFSLCPIGRIYIPNSANLSLELAHLLNSADILRDRKNVIWFKTKDYSLYRKLLGSYPHHRYSSNSLLYLEGISTSDNRFDYY